MGQRRRVNPQPTIANGRLSAAVIIERWGRRCGVGRGSPADTHRSDVCRVSIHCLNAGLGVARRVGRVSALAEVALENELGPRVFVSALSLPRRAGLHPVRAVSLQTLDSTTPTM